MKHMVVYKIKELDNLIERKMIRYCKLDKSFVITPMQAHILKYLADNDNVFQRDLEKKFKFRRSTALGILKTMEKNNLIERSLINENSRLKKIVITKYGVEKLNDIMNKLNNFESMITKNISSNDLSIFLKVLNKMEENIKEEENDD